MDKLGQRFAATISVVIVAFIAVLIGDTPASTQELLTGLVAPLGTVLATVYFLIQAIQNNVRAGNITPGKLLEVFQRREFALSLALAGVFLANRYFGIRLEETNQAEVVNTLTLFIMGAITMLVKSYGERGNGDTEDNGVIAVSIDDFELDASHAGMSSISESIIDAMQSQLKPRIIRPADSVADSESAFDAAATHPEG